MRYWGWVYSGVKGEREGGGRGDGGREGRGERGREGGREGWREGGKRRGRKGGREGGKRREREREREGGRGTTNQRAPVGVEVSNPESWYQLSEGNHKKVEIQEKPELLKQNLCVKTKNNS